MFSLGALDRGEGIAALHEACRVINRSGRDRYSMPLFFEGAPGFVVSALPGCVGVGEAALFPPTTVSAHLAEMYRRTYG